MSLLTLELFGNVCNDAPELIVLADGSTLWQGYVAGFKTLDFEIAGTPKVQLKGIGKRQGEQNVWDTYIDQEGNILNDKYLLIKGIAFDRIQMGQRWLQSLSVSYKHGQNLLTGGGLWSNGEISLQWREPLLDWIIEEKFCKFERYVEGCTTDRNGSSRFDYKFVQEKLQAIRRLLDD